MADNPTLYNIGLDPDSVQRVISWAIAHVPDWSDDSDPFPAGLSTGDITFIGAKMARTHEQAVEDLLDIDGKANANGGTTVARLAYVRTAALDGVAIAFVVSAASYVGVLPVELERKLKFG